MIIVSGHFSQAGSKSEQLPAAVVSLHDGIVQTGVSIAKKTAATSAAAIQLTLSSLSDKTSPAREHR